MRLQSIIDAMPPLFFFVLAFVLMLFIGNPLIAWLQKKQWKKDSTAGEIWAVREDTPDTHQVKRGTPSMGGIGIVAATLLTVVLLGYELAARSYLPYIRSFVVGFPSSGSILEFFFCFFAALVLMFVLVAHGLLGFADDYSKASGRGGLRARTKLIGQILLALGFVAYVVLMSSTVRSNVYISADFAGIHLIEIAVLAFVVVAVCNAVNLTDGIDGLAAGLTVQSALALGLVATQWAMVESFSRFTLIALAGACFGFLFFNRFPARVFMGDTGSLSIGATLGAGAILQHAVFLLPFIGFIYFVEMFSVIAQVAWFKWTKRKTGEGKRLFRRAPLHHHFELSGWSEWRVVGTFWAINLFTSAIGLWLWQVGVLPRWP